MVILSKSHLTSFGALQPDAITALNDWYTKTKVANWNNFNEIRQTFNAADYVGNDRYVFNIRGNRYRLIAMVFFDIRTVYIRFVGTHSEYDKNDASTI